MNTKQRNKVLLILAASLVIAGCGAGGLFGPTQTPYPTYTPPAPDLLPATALVGQWEEYWGVGEDTDVTYNDVYDISLNGNNEFQITCVERPNYGFEGIVFDGATLSVRLNNEGFFIDYILTVADDPTLLTGTAETRDGTYRVVWAKMK